MKTIMKTITEKINAVGLYLCLIVLNVSTALGADDPFAAATAKTDEMSDLLGGKFAVALCTLIIVIASIALMMNKLRMDWALRIIGGAILIGSAAAIATWVMAE